MSILDALVKSVLDKWPSYTWTVQGFGFIRTKIQDVGRVHVWDSRLMTPLVSTIHTHPWPLRSRIISGGLINQRFYPVESPGDGAMPYSFSRIATGEGGGLVGEIGEELLRSFPPEFYVSGNAYEQEPSEIHQTIAQDGTVTLIERPQGPLLEEAVVYWPFGTEWVSAEPQEAPHHMVSTVISLARERWWTENDRLKK